MFKELHIKSKNPWLKYLSCFLIFAIPVVFLCFFENFVWTWALIIQRHEKLNGYGFFNIDIKAIDHNIPLINGFFKFIYLYATWVFIPLSFFGYFYLYGQQKLYKIVINYVITVCVFFVVWIIFPTFAYGPQHDGTNTNQFQNVDGKVDTIHYCEFPSGHAFFASFVLIQMCFNYRKNKDWGIIFVSLLPISLLIIIATFFVKQHYFIDPFITIALIILITFLFNLIFKNSHTFLKWFNNLMYKINSWLLLQTIVQTKNTTKTITWSYVLLGLYISIILVWFGFFTLQFGTKFIV